MVMMEVVEEKRVSFILPSSKFVYSFFSPSECFCPLRYENLWYNILPICGVRRTFVRDALPRHLLTWPNEYHSLPFFF